jgi:hypothetical protein
MIYYLAALLGLAIGCLLVGELKLYWEDPFDD